MDFALMIHPTCGGESRNYINRNGRASGSLTISFTGQSAHSSAPATGINALIAAISVFNQIDMLRPLFETEDNVNGVILEGGTASNIIPGFSKSEFCIRAATMKRVDELQNMIISCAKRAESLTGAKVQIQSEPIYAERYPCLPICEDFKENMARYPQFGTAIDQLHDSAPQSAGALLSVFPEARQVVETEIENMLNNGTSPEEAASEMAQQINKVIGEYNLLNE